MTMKNFNEFLSEGGEQLNEATDPFSTIEDAKSKRNEIEKQFNNIRNIYSVAKKEINSTSNNKEQKQAKDFLKQESMALISTLKNIIKTAETDMKKL